MRDLRGGSPQIKSGNDSEKKRKKPREKTKFPHGGSPGSSPRSHLKLKNKKYRRKATPIKKILIWEKEWEGGSNTSTKRKGEKNKIKKATVKKKIEKNRKMYNKGGSCPKKERRIGERNRNPLERKRHRTQKKDHSFGWGTHPDETGKTWKANTDETFLPRDASGTKKR